MNRKPIKSSTISEIGYDRDTCILEVKFIKGMVYQYTNVDASTYNALMNAESQGRFFSQYIKGTYPALKVD